MLAQLRTLLQNDSIGVSRSARGVSDPRCNIVHLARPPPPRLSEQARRAADDWSRRRAGVHADNADAASSLPPSSRASAVLRVGRAEEDALERGLVPAWLARAYPELARAIASDAGELARMVLEYQPCDRWHADTVGARALVTYAGPGTQYLPNARVRRGWDRSGAPVVAGLRHGEAGGGGGGGEEDGGGGAFSFEEAAAWDVLLLKGHACPGMMGMGAVHRSPPMDEEEEECAVGESAEGEAEAAAATAGARGARLVLTVDDAVPCECCPAPAPASERAVR